ncbi:hypothetical protein KSZ35_13785 [Bacteroides xylanisolvens]|uniref:hypothetical protein n=1 Tax=Bacteroides TaxID=816 RepID=UPI001C255DD3|nr:MULTISPECIES: hypothetical protein [Bacteroides]MBU9951600.1 hypothetical protein [Bacteroides sp. MSK.20.12]MBV3451378.1 hypothetical protein [Bacteroides xylanisolvens]MBV4221763.1 hypothetical protein [Bacteroides xylanisolvens]
MLEYPHAIKRLQQRIIQLKTFFHHTYNRPSLKKEYLNRREEDNPPLSTRTYTISAAFANKKIHHFTRIVYFPSKQKQIPQPTIFLLPIIIQTRTFYHHPTIHKEKQTSPPKEQNQAFASSPPGNEASLTEKQSLPHR